MSSFVVTCGECGRQTIWREQRSGTAVRCPGCRTDYVLPAFDAEAPQQPVVATAPPSPSPAVAPPPAATAAAHAVPLVRCDACGEPFEAANVVRDRDLTLCRDCHAGAAADRRDEVPAAAAPHDDGAPDAASDELSAIAAASAPASGAARPPRRPAARPASGRLVRVVSSTPS